MTPEAFRAAPGDSPVRVQPVSRPRPVILARPESTPPSMDLTAEVGLPDDPPGARGTVGGVIAVGQSGLRRLRYGPVRDTVLEVRYVSAEGVLVKGGGPVVKNVSRFCRDMMSCQLLTTLVKRS